jgi:hypothetical protein
MLTTKQAAKPAIKVAPDFVEIRRTARRPWATPTASATAGALTIGAGPIVFVCATTAIGIAGAIGLRPLIVRRRPTTPSGITDRKNTP